MPQINSTKTGGQITSVNPGAAHLISRQTNPNRPHPSQRAATFYSAACTLISESKCCTERPRGMRPRPCRLSLSPRPHTA